MLNLNVLDYGKGNEWDALEFGRTKMKCNHQKLKTREELSLSDDVQVTESVAIVNFHRNCKNLAFARLRDCWPLHSKG